jgi:hypothetical protein
MACLTTATSVAEPPAPDPTPQPTATPSAPSHTEVLQGFHEKYFTSPEQAHMSTYGMGEGFANGYPTAYGLSATGKELMVAHNGLPAGTIIAFLYKGKTSVAVVADTGDFGAGKSVNQKVKFDLYAPVSKLLGNPPHEDLVSYQVLWLPKQTRNYQQQLLQAHYALACTNGINGKGRTLLKHGMTAVQEGAVGRNFLENLQMLKKDLQKTSSPIPQELCAALEELERLRREQQGNS